MVDGREAGHGWRGASRGAAISIGRRRGVDIGAAGGALALHVEEAGMHVEVGALDNEEGGGDTRTFRYLAKDTMRFGDSAENAGKTAGTRGGSRIRWHGREEARDRRCAVPSMDRGGLKRTPGGVRRRQPAR